MTTKTLIPQINNTYSSFPTMTEHGDKIFVFYRQGIRSNIQCHGVKGEVKCFEIEKALFLEHFYDDTESLYEFGKDITVFKGENEIDAIASRLETNIYSLCTRNYIVNEPMKTYISFSDTPSFSERYEVKVKGPEWIVFYGKAFKCNHGYVFPAYGDLKGNRPLLLYTEDLSSWEILSYVQGDFKGMILNESSVVFDGRKYIVFMREDTVPFGIWYSSSYDLKDWSHPEKLVSSAHAPMSIYKDGKIYLTFRELLSYDTSAVTLMSPFSGPVKITLDVYKGNPYDGGYTDMAVIDGRLFIVYFSGNEVGEPCIKCCEVGSDVL